MKRQGELLFQPIIEFPTNRRLVAFWIENNETVLAKGKISGHSHVLKGDFVLYRDKKGVFYLEVKTKAKVIHEEHKTIYLDKGKYIVLRQKEYTPKKVVYIND